MIAALGHLEIGARSKAGRTTTAHVRTAFDQGGPAVASRAALFVGAAVSSRCEAVPYLLYAVRSASKEIAVSAAMMLADLVTDEPEVADYYRSKADEQPSFRRG